MDENITNNNPIQPQTVPIVEDIDNTNAKIGSETEELRTPTFTPPPPLSLEFSTSSSEYQDANSNTGDSNENYNSHTNYIEDYDSHPNSTFHSLTASELKGCLSKTDETVQSAINILNEANLEGPASGLSICIVSPPDPTPYDNIDPSLKSSNLLNSSERDPSATYTCNSPADTNVQTDLPSTSLDHLLPLTIGDRSHVSPSTSDTSDTRKASTPDPYLTSSISSEEKDANCFFKGDDMSHTTLSTSDSQKKSQDATSDPMTNTSSEKARRSSPSSSPDQSISSLPSDTITMNAAISSIGTDTDPNDNLPRDSESRQSNDETDPATDSAFASPSLSPTPSKSSTVTPIIISESNRSEKDSKVDEKCPNGNIDLDSFTGSQVDFAEDAIENESIIYEESECDIRIPSSRDEVRDSSPENASTSAIAEICNLESRESDRNFHDTDNGVSSKLGQDKSSSGYSSMSNSPGFSADINLPKRISEPNRENLQSEHLRNYRNIHLNNWINENQRNNDPPLISKVIPERFDYVHHTDNSETIIVISDESFSDTLSNGVGSVRNLPYFDPLPTIHEVTDTPPTLSPNNESLDESSLLKSNLLPSFANSERENVSMHGTLSSPSIEIPPPRKSPLTPPPLPPPPMDDDAVNSVPIPPLPSEYALRPPLPPLPLSSFLVQSPQPFPFHAESPTPPQRLYVLIPIKYFEPNPKTVSPPAAPPRSTSLRRSPPPSTPKSNISPIGYRPANEVRDAVGGDSSNADTEDEEIRSTSSPSDVSSVICVSKLTPVPEEKHEPSPTLNEKQKAVTYLENTLETSVINKSYQTFIAKSVPISSPSPPPPPPRSKISVPTPPPPPLFPKPRFLTEQPIHQCTMKATEASTGPPPPPPPKLSSGNRLNQRNASDGTVSTFLDISAHLSISKYGKLVVDRSDISLPPPEEEISKVFSSGLRWGWLKTGLDTLAIYTQLKPLIQRGPQCGIVALSMASQLLVNRPKEKVYGGTPPEVSGGTPLEISGGTPLEVSGGIPPDVSGGIPPEELLAAAQEAGYSVHGEMFSARALANLASNKLGDVVKADVKRDVLSDKHHFLELLMSGDIIIVPYDSQQNHQPGMYRGHKAHWGVVSGAIVQTRHLSEGRMASFATPDFKVDRLWHLKKQSNLSVSSSLAEASEPHRVLNRPAFTALRVIKPEDLHVVVVWRQGKSRLLTSSTLEDLCASNLQLVEYSTTPSLSGFEHEFVVGDVEAGLAGQVVVLSRTDHPAKNLSKLLTELNS